MRSTFTATELLQQNCSFGPNKEHVIPPTWVTRLYKPYMNNRPSTLLVKYEVGCFLKNLLPRRQEFCSFH